MKWTIAHVGPSMYRHRDSGVITELRAETYPYGAGQPDHGVQITLERDQVPIDPRLLTLRLPHPDAVQLAKWILRTYGWVDDGSDFRPIRGRSFVVP